MASATDIMACSCTSGKRITSFCKKHIQALCLDCLLAAHKECIADIITIEMASKNMHPLWNEIYSKCESYKLLYEKQKLKKEEVYQKMDATDKEFRMTISKMRLEMIKRINLICKNALELSVSVMSQRVSVAKSDVEKLDSAYNNLCSLQTFVENENRLKDSEIGLFAKLNKARHELSVIERTFKELKENKNEVLIQFVVPPIVTDFLEHFNSLGEIIEEVKEDGRTSVYISDQRKKEFSSRAHVERSHNPFRALKSVVDNPIMTAESKDKVDDLFVFQKGIYGQEDGSLYAYIDVHKSVDSTGSDTPAPPMTKMSANIPPLPAKPSLCLNLNAKRNETHDVFVQSDSNYCDGSDKSNDMQVPVVDKAARPIPRPRLSIGKSIKIPGRGVETHFKDPTKHDQTQRTDKLCHLPHVMISNSARQSVSSEESNSSSKTAKTDSGIMLHIDDKSRSCDSSPTNELPSLMPLQVRNDMFSFPWRELRNSDPALSSEDNKHFKPLHLPLSLSKSTARTRFPSEERKGTPIKNTSSNYSALGCNTNTDDRALDTYVNPADNLQGLDSIKHEQTGEENIGLSMESSIKRFNTRVSSTAMSTMELQSHTKDIKDVCIITSLAVSKNQCLIICDYSHNCIQVYDSIDSRVQIYGIAKPFGLCLLSESKIAVTSRERSSINIFNVFECVLKFEREHRLGNLVSVFGISYSNGYICVCCLTNLMLFTEDMSPYSSVKAISGFETKGTLKRKKCVKPAFSGVKYCAIDFNHGRKEIFVSDFKQDKVIRINAEGEIKWVQSVKAPKSVALNQGKLYVAAKKQIVIMDTGKGLTLREVHEGVPKYPWSLFIDDATSTMFITNGSINDPECRKIQTVPLKILTVILG